MAPALAAEIFSYLHANDRPIYKAAIQGLANQRKLRPVFIERKPPNERHPWMQSALSRPISEALAAHLIQAWLLGAHKEMLCDFLDALGIEHGEDGTVEQLPPPLPKDKIAEAVDRLLQKHSPETVAVYLHVFRDMDSEVKWPSLDEILAEDARLKL
jgi:hypothetical protein